MNTPRPPYWFHAKRYGWGWGLPASWQGWIVLITWIGIVSVGSPLLASRSMPLFFVFIALMCAVILAICFAKGEPPKWRWGKP
ncbi:MAG: hypothetical protein ABSH22_06240 [Tepidisphaeraceae bacterium]|jgi:uncharacterized membrane protein YhaH (DUF805 family)